MITDIPTYIIVLLLLVGIASLLAYKIYNSKKVRRSAKGWFIVMIASIMISFILAPLTIYNINQFKTEVRRPNDVHTYSRASEYRNARNTYGNTSIIILTITNISGIIYLLVGRQKYKKGKYASIGNNGVQGSSQSNSTSKNCPHCKNPNTNNSTTCEWCGGRIS